MPSHSRYTQQMVALSLTIACHFLGGCALLMPRTPPQEEAAAMKESLSNYVSAGMSASDAQRALQRVGFTVERKKGEALSVQASGRDELAPASGDFLEGIRKPGYLPTPNPGYRVVLPLADDRVREVRVDTVRK